MTRKEALKYIKNMWMSKETHDALETLIPEFGESEDERTRKELIEYHRKMVDSLGEIGKEKHNRFLSYLEKQKEQKPVSNPKWAELTWKDINELERIINNVHYEFQNGIGEDSFGELVLERFKEYKDDGSMDEQKPAECERQPEFKEVEYDFRGEKVKVMRPFFRDDKGREFSTTGQDTDLTWSVLREWCEIKGITPYDLYPRAEWSEEDEKMLRTIISDGSRGVELDSKQISFLKSLRPQKLDVSKLENYDPVEVLNKIKMEWPMAWEKAVGKQEWSEEDEKNLELVIDCIYEYYPDPVKKYKLKDWLKFLRPQKKEDLPKWRKWRNGGCGNGDGIPIAIVKSGTGYELVSSLGFDGQEYIMLSDLEKLPKEK